MDEFNQYKYEQLSIITAQLDSELSEDSSKGSDSISVQESEDIDSWIVEFINGEGSFYLRNNKCLFRTYW